MNAQDQHNHKGEILTTSQRFGDMIAASGMMLLFAFLVYHKLADTGFYTDKFRMVEQICLFVPLLLGMSAPLMRAFTGTRNPARFWEATSDLALALGSLWLLSVFPFNYEHLADALPNGLHFILSWVTDDIARVVFVLQIIGATISGVVIMGKYLQVWYLSHQHSH